MCNGHLTGARGGEKTPIGSRFIGVDMGEFSHFFPFFEENSSAFYLQPALEKVFYCEGVDLMLLGEDPLGKGFLGVTIEDGNDSLNYYRARVGALVDEIDRRT